MSTDTIEKVDTKTELKEPSMYKVIYLNDNETSMQFVIESLITFFEYSFDAAQDVTMEIHEHDSAVVAVLPYEIAEQKGVEVTVAARDLGFPLQVKVEAE